MTNSEAFQTVGNALNAARDAAGDAANLAASVAESAGQYATNIANAAGASFDAAAAWTGSLAHTGTGMLTDTLPGLAGDAFDGMVGAANALAAAAANAFNAANAAAGQLFNLAGQLSANAFNAAQTAIANARNVGQSALNAALALRRMLSNLGGLEFRGGGGRSGGGGASGSWDDPYVVSLSQYKGACSVGVTGVGFTGRFSFPVDFPHHNNYAAVYWGRLRFAWLWAGGVAFDTEIECGRLVHETISGDILSAFQPSYARYKEASGPPWIVCYPELLDTKALDPRILESPPISDEEKFALLLSTQDRSAYVGRYEISAAHVQRYDANCQPWRLENWDRSQSPVVRVGYSSTGAALQYEKRYDWLKGYIESWHLSGDECYTHEFFFLGGDAVTRRKIPAGVATTAGLLLAAALGGLGAGGGGATTLAGSQPHLRGGGGRGNKL